jgi:hypothetical protein
MEQAPIQTRVYKLPPQYLTAPVKEITVNLPNGYFIKIKLNVTYCFNIILSTFFNETTELK